MSSCLRTRRRRLRVLGGLAHGREITGSRAHDPTGVSQSFVAFCLGCEPANRSTGAPANVRSFAALSPLGSSLRMNSRWLPMGARRAQLSTAISPDSASTRQGYRSLDLCSIHAKPCSRVTIAVSIGPPTVLSSALTAWDRDSTPMSERATETRDATGNPARTS
jgi:hypothetical protein